MSNLIDMNSALLKAEQNRQDRIQEEWDLLAPDEKARRVSAITDSWFERKIIGIYLDYGDVYERSQKLDEAVEMLLEEF